MKSIALPNFNDGLLITIPLDPKLDAKQNAKKCFQRYTKGKSGQIHIQRQLDLTQDEIDYLRLSKNNLRSVISKML